MTEPTYEQLLAYAAGGLSPAEAALIAAYLAQHAQAAETVRLYQLAHGTLRADDTVSPPDATLAAAQALFREQQARRPQVSWLAGLRQVVAGLVFDSRQQVALAGLRGQHAGYQLTFESDLADVDLEVTPTDGPTAPRSVRGQIAPHADVRVTHVTLTASDSGETRASAEADEGGMFNLTIAPGRFDLYVAVDGSVLVLSDVEIE